jgi:hypothetical protein
MNVLSVAVQQSVFEEKWNRAFRPKMRQRKNAGAVSVSGQRETGLEHFQEKWSPVFRPKMRQTQKC